MQALQIILFIILFIICLSILVMVHEAGHFIAAKAFKVYCKEFSIGFGPALLHKKRKNGETYFSIRAIPFGGYVSMYGEDAEEAKKEKENNNEVSLQKDQDEFSNIDPSRSFLAAKKWKRIIILFAGVFMNAILAIILFFISNSCFVQKIMYLNVMEVKQDSIAETSGIQNFDSPWLREDINGKSLVYVLDYEGIAYYQDHEVTVAAVLDPANITYDQRSYDFAIHYYEYLEEKVSYGKEINLEDSTLLEIDFNLKTKYGLYKQYSETTSTWIEVSYSPSLSPVVDDVYYNKEELQLYRYDGSNWVKSEAKYTGYELPKGANPKNKEVWLDTEAKVDDHFLSLETVNKDNKQTLEEIGVSFYLHEWWNNFGEAWQATFSDFGNSATAIGRGLASIFTTPDGWQNVGGIISIGVQTSNILKNFGFGKFLYVWGFISVNLAIMNLLPFPALDGWQILVTLVEMIFHKEIPSKFKSWASIIGFVLLFTLMALIIVKDVIGLF